MTIKAFCDADSRGRLSGLKYLSPFGRDYSEVMWHVLLMRELDKRQVFSWRSVPFLTDSRLSHTITVARLANVLAEDLGLNKYLTAAIALCHDVAHCPYGHLGEIVLSGHLRAIGRPEYDHKMVAPYLLNTVANLDLSVEVLEGIACHSLSTDVMRREVPSEYRVVAISDTIAYTLSDAADAVAITSNDFYREVTLLEDEETATLHEEAGGLLCSLGMTASQRFHNVISALVAESSDAGEIRFGASPEALVLAKLRDLLLAKFYTKTDLPDDIWCLHGVINKLVASDVGVNPYLLFALLTDGELKYLGSLRAITPGDLSLLQVSEFNLPDRDDYDFLEPFVGS